VSVSKDSEALFESISGMISAAIISLVNPSKIQGSQRRWNATLMGILEYIKIPERFTIAGMSVESSQADIDRSQTS
jgi:hypothetical protein